MNKTFKFRLYPSKKQEQQMCSVLDRCRFVYNMMLEGLQKQEKIDRSILQSSIPNLKIKYPQLNRVYSKVLTYECYRLFSNLRALARLKKNGKRVGRLRFKGKEWFKTFTYNQSGFKLTISRKRYQKLYLSKIGDIPMRMHRRIKGKIKQVTVKKHPSGKWYASVFVEYEKEMLFTLSTKKKKRKAVGIDLGLVNFIYDSDGNSISHPKFITVSIKRLQILQWQLARKKKGSINRKKQKLRVAVQYEKICNQRNDFLHKLSRQYVNSHDIIAVEALEVRNIIKITYNSRNTNDASWSGFLHMLKYKAESAGIQLIRVEPRGTSQICSGCGKKVPKKLWNRIHKCDNCGLTVDRDYNAAINILNRGLQQIEIGQGLPEYTPLREGTTTNKNACCYILASSFNERGSHSI